MYTTLSYADIEKYFPFNSVVKFPKLPVFSPTALLYICERNNNIYSFVTNNINPFNKNYYKENIILDHEKCKKYLDLFEKYKLLLDTYKYLKNSCLKSQQSHISKH